MKWEKYDKCFQFFNELLNSNLKLNKYIYSIIINLFSKLKQPLNCEKYFKEMKNNKIKPDIYHYCSLIEAYNNTE